MDQEVKAYIDAKLAEIEKRLAGNIRDLRTELMQGYEVLATNQTLRLRKVEADRSSLDTALCGRADVLETRLMEIELRLARTLLTHAIPQSSPLHPPPPALRRNAG